MASKNTFHLEVAHPRTAHRELAHGQHLSPRTRARHDRGCATNHGGALYAQCARLYMLYYGSGQSDPEVGVKPLAGEGKETMLDICGQRARHGSIRRKMWRRCPDRAFEGGRRFAVGGVGASGSRERGTGEAGSPDGRAPLPGLPLSDRRRGVATPNALSATPASRFAPTADNRMVPPSTSAAAVSLL